MPPDELLMPVLKALNRRRICRMYFRNPKFEYIIRKAVPYTWQLLDDGKQIENGIAETVTELINIYRELELKLNDT